MSGKIMMEGVDSVMNRERVATDVVNEMKNREGFWRRWRENGVG